MPLWFPLIPDVCIAENGALVGFISLTVHMQRWFVIMLSTHFVSTSKEEHKLNVVREKAGATEVLVYAG